jgi:coenzyme A diphosphatase NUDT7
MFPRLDAKEVAAVFSAPFHNFLRAQDEVANGLSTPGKRSDWYDGFWTEWNGGRWRMHNFHVPITNQMVSKPKVREGEQAALAEKLDKDKVERYLVWGMTSRMLVEVARIAYDEAPEFEVSLAFLGTIKSECELT